MGCDLKLHLYGAQFAIARSAPNPFGIVLMREEKSSYEMR